MILYISLFSIITSAIIAIYNWRINKNALLLTGIFVIFSTYGLTHYFTVYNVDEFWTALFYGNLSPFWYLPGAMLYLYTRNTLQDRPLFSSWKDALHLIPFVLQAINMAPYILSSFDYKLEMTRLILADINNVRTHASGFFLPPAFAFVTRPSLIIIYVIFCFRLIYSYSKKEQASLANYKQNRLVYNWLITLNLATLIVSVGFLVLTLKLYDLPISKILINSEPTHLISGIAFALLPFALVVLFPQILYGMPVAIHSKKPKKVSAVAVINLNDPLSETAETIVDYLKSEKPYLNPDFDLEDIEEALEIPKHHITYCFAYILNKKFTSYRSWIRIEHAKELLKGGSADSLSIDGIGSQSGFPSRSSFYATFKAETGMTPSQYLETIA